MDEADAKRLRSVPSVGPASETQSSSGFAPHARHGTLRRSQVPTGEFDRGVLAPQLKENGRLASPNADQTLRACIELAHSLRPDLNDDGVVQSFVTALCALLPGRRVVARLLPRTEAGQEGGLWTTGPILEGGAERFRVERATLLRYGFSPEVAYRAGLDVIDAYEGEFHRAAEGFHIPIFFDREIFGVVAIEYYPGVGMAPDDPIAAGQLAIQLGACLAHRHAREDSAKLEEQILHAERLATVGQLAAGVVHELNNPLTSISAYAEHLLKKHEASESSPDDIEKLRRIVQGADRIMRFTRDLVAYARPPQEDTESLYLQEVVDESIIFCEHLIREYGADVDVEVEPPLPPVPGVRGQLHQVLINLITNACHAMPEGAGRLQIRLRAPSSERLELAVRDNGSGIPSHLCDAIFEPFFSTKGQGQGTGLGLSIVRNILRHHGGAIRVESVIGEGTTFIVELPTGAAGVSVRG